MVEMFISDYKHRCEMFQQIQHILSYFYLDEVAVDREVVEFGEV
jgi:uncharacterized membrane protein (UPF0182 family)